MSSGPHRAPWTRRATGGAASTWPRSPTRTLRTGSSWESHLSPRARQAATTRRREAENQLRLLRNEDDESGHSDFYTYRYFASEGFLPGYSFPRLPLAAYIPAVRGTVGPRDGGDYIQRPRFLAISEFGPGALIYHEGARYEVNRVQVPLAQSGQATVDTTEARRCEACGYHHDRRAGLDVCENCGEELGATTYGLMQLTCTRVAASGSPRMRRSAAAPASSCRRPTGSVSTAPGRASCPPRCWPTAHRLPTWPTATRPRCG